MIEYFVIILFIGIIIYQEIKNKNEIKKINEKVAKDIEMYVLQNKELQMQNKEVTNKFADLIMEKETKFYSSRNSVMKSEPNEIDLDQMNELPNKEFNLQFDDEVGLKNKKYNINIK